MSGPAGAEAAQQPAGVHLGGGEEGAQLVVELPGQPRPLGLAGVGEVAGEVRQLAGALGHRGFEGQVLPLEQLADAHPQAGLALLHGEQHDDQPDGAQGQQGDRVLHLAEAGDRFAHQRPVALLEALAQHADRQADLVGVGLADAALAGRAGADHAAGLDGVGEQLELEADQPASISTSCRSVLPGG
jgi:hypothetical protein